MELTTTTILQVVVALGLLNVWLVRAQRATSYRGGSARSLSQEFEAYGLSRGAFLAVGTLKVGSAIALLVGLWVPQLVLPAAAVVAVLMVGALAMHAKVKDPLVRSLPALAMLAMSASLVFLSIE